MQNQCCKAYFWNVLEVQVCVIYSLLMQICLLMLITYSLNQLIPENQTKQIVKLKKSMIKTSKSIKVNDLF